MKSKVQQLEERSKIDQSRWSEERDSLNVNVARLNKSIKTRLKTIYIGQNKNKEEQKTTDKNAHKNECRAFLCSILLQKPGEGRSQSVREEEEYGVYGAGG